MVALATGASPGPGVLSWTPVAVAVFRSSPVPVTITESGCVPLSAKVIRAARDPAAWGTMATPTMHELPVPAWSRCTRRRRCSRRPHLHRCP